MDGFGSPFIVKTFKVPFSALQYWDRTGLVKPSLRPAAGRGSKRLYSFKDLVQILVVVRLRELGISLQRVRRCLRFLRKHFAEVEVPLAEVTLVTDGESTFVLTDDATKLLDTLREQVVWSLPIASIVKSARGTIEQATTPQVEKVSVAGREFTVTLEQDPEDGWWVGLVEELPGCGSQGGTLGELREMIADAIRTYLAIQQEFAEDAEETETDAVAV